MNPCGVCSRACRGRADVTASVLNTLLRDIFPTALDTHLRFGGHVFLRTSGCRVL